MRLAGMILPLLVLGAMPLAFPAAADEPVRIQVELTWTSDGLTVSFRDNGSFSTAGRIVGYWWAFGDGTSDVGMSVTHRYERPGTYYYSLHVWDEWGNNRSLERKIILPLETSVRPRLQGMDVQAGILSPYPAEVVNVSWEWGDGRVETGGLNASHRYADPGTYVIRARVSYGCCLAWAVRTVVVPLPAFVINATADGLTLRTRLDTPVGGLYRNLSWEWGDGSSASVGEGSSHTYRQAGLYRVRLVGEDHLGWPHEATVDVFVLPKAVVDLRVSGLAVEVSEDDLPAGDAARTRYEWTWGDGSPSGTTRAATHTYASPGRYQALLRMTHPAFGTRAFPFEVDARLPVPAFSFSVDGSEVSFDASGSRPGGAPISRYTWNFGDGTPLGSGLRTTHTYAKEGTYVVRLVVVDANGATDGVQKEVTLAAPPAPTPLSTTPAPTVGAERIPEPTMKVPSAQPPTVTSTEVPRKEVVPSPTPTRAPPPSLPVDVDGPSVGRTNEVPGVVIQPPEEQPGVGAKVLQGTKVAAGWLGTRAVTTVQYLAEPFLFPVIAGVVAGLIVAYVRFRKEWS